MTAAAPAIDPSRYRQVLGQYPTGVCAVTAIDANGAPIAMVVGSFTSVSLDPPLVAFFPDRNSSSWANLRAVDRFCINFLAASQEALCRTLASKDPDKFRGIAHRSSELGNPLIDGVVGWIECDLHSVMEAGDHDMVLGRIVALDIETGDLPLLFFQGGYGRFAPSSLGAADTRGLSLSQLRMVDRARPAMERLAADTSAQCIATVPSGKELIIAASAGQPRRGGTPSLVGQHLPFIPPTGAVFAAWMDERSAASWIGDDRRDDVAARLALVRRRGYSLGLLNDAQRAFVATLHSIAESENAELEGSLADIAQGLAYDPDELSAETRDAVRVISMPVFGPSGEVMLALTLHGFPKPPAGEGIEHFIRRLGEAAAAVTATLGSVSPSLERLQETI